MMTTRSSGSFLSTSALVTEWMPPSTYSVPPMVTGAEVAGDGARGQHGLGQAGRRGPGAAEDDRAAVVAAHGADAQSFGPALADVLVEAAGPLADVDLAPGNERGRGDLGAEGERPARARGR